MSDCSRRRHHVGNISIILEQHVELVDFDFDRGKEAPGACMNTVAKPKVILASASLDALYDPRLESRAFAQSDIYQIYRYPGSSQDATCGCCQRRSCHLS